MLKSTFMVFCADEIITIARANEYYVAAKNDQLRTDKDLNLTPEEPIDPKSIKANRLEKALNQVGFNDKEDIKNLACLKWLKQNRGYIPIFATTDTELYEYKDIIYEKTGVIVEDALYAALTHSSVASKPWPIEKSSLH